MGLAVSDAELATIDSVPTLAVRRYDRAQNLERIHQEDGCQATASAAGWKYEYQGGPSLRDFAKVLRDFGTTDDLSDLLRRVTLNVVIGNADAHAKNFSVLHLPDEDGIRLAPVYDVIATVAAEPVDDRGRRIEPDRRMGQRVGEASFVDEVTREHLLDEAATWGLRSQRAAEVIDDMLQRIAIAVTEIDQAWLADLVSSNLERIG